MEDVRRCAPAVAFTNMFESMEASGVEQMETDVGMEMMRFGRVLDCEVIPSCGAVKVYFDNAESAMKCALGLDGSRFDGRIIGARYVGSGAGGGGFGDGGAATSRPRSSESTSACDTSGRRGAALPEDRRQRKRPPQPQHARTRPPQAAMTMIQTRPRPDDDDFDFFLGT